MLRLQGDDRRECSRTASVMCRMTLVVRKRKKAKGDQRIKGKLKREDCCEDFRGRLRGSGWS